MILNLCIVVIEGLIVGIPCYLMFRNHNRRMRGPVFLHVPVASPFKVSAYLARMEKVHLDLLKEHQPVDGTITLWLGLDGLQIAPDGESEWIRREPFQTVTPPLIFAPPLPSRWLPTPPPVRYGSSLWADNQEVLACCTDSEAYMRVQLDKLRSEYEAALLRAQLDRIKNQKMVNKHTPAG